MPNQFKRQRGFMKGSSNIMLSNNEFSNICITTILMIRLHTLNILKHAEDVMFHVLAFSLLKGVTVLHSTKLKIECYLLG